MAAVNPVTGCWIQGYSNVPEVRETQQKAELELWLAALATEVDVACQEQLPLCRIDTRDSKEESRGCSGLCRRARKNVPAHCL